MLVDSWPRRRRWRRGGRKTLSISTPILNPHLSISSFCAIHRSIHTIRRPIKRIVVDPARVLLPHARLHSKPVHVCSAARFLHIPHRRNRPPGVSLPLVFTAPPFPLARRWNPRLVSCPLLLGRILFHRTRRVQLDPCRARVRWRGCRGLAPSVDVRELGRGSARAGANARAGRGVLFPLPCSLAPFRGW